MFCGNIPELVSNGTAKTLGSSNALLIEFLPYEQSHVIKQAVRMLYNEGFTAVLAHTERYIGINEPQIIEELKTEYGAVIQINASAVIKSAGLFGNRYIKKIIRNGLADIIGSDAHNTAERKTRIGDAYAVLAKEYGAETADRLCRKNALSLLGETV